MEDQIEGGLNRAAGRVQDTLGAAAGDAGMQAKGKVRQAAGQLQQGYGNALDSIRTQALENPLATIAVAVSVGFLLGAYWSSRD